jgi:predicted RNA-binding Zn-ribbon protein involved in translation (DUF1610 family)
MGTIIGAYHEIPTNFALELPVVQRRASRRGIAGTDLPWCWIDRLRIRQEQGPPYPQSVDEFRCPCCGETVVLRRQDEPDDELGFLYFIGLCGGCGTVWWW